MLKRIEMKYLAYFISAISCMLLLLTMFELHFENQEIAALNNQISGLEQSSIQDGVLINQLKTKLLKRSHSKKKVICLGDVYVA